jgi:hypothetical protein
MGIVLFVASLANGADAKFVGSAKCKMCHVAGAGGTAYKVWEKSAHAGAYKTLLDEKSIKIAKEKGLKVAAHEAPECLKCHVTGGGTAKNVDKSFKMEEGVGCEACHGAASGFLMIHNKKDDASKKKAVEAGFIKVEKSEKFCTTCHNSESPTFKGFKLEEAWAKIEHGKKK